MKNFTTRMTIAAAALVAAAGMASAQTMKAEIPFAFQVSGVVLAPGGYEVSLQYTPSGSHLLQFRNSDSRRSVLAMAVGAEDPHKDWTAAGGPKLSFVCGASQCSLAETWNAQPGEPAYRFSTPKLGKDEPRRVAVVPMRIEKGE